MDYGGLEGEEGQGGKGDGGGGAYGVLLLDGELKVDLAGRGVFYAELGEGVSIQVAWVLNFQGARAHTCSPSSLHSSLAGESRRSD